MFNGGYKVSELISKSGKNYVPNVALKAMLPYIVGLDVPSLPFSIPASPTLSKVVGFQSPRTAYQGGFEGNYLMFEDSTDGTAAANWTVNFVDYAGRYLMNFPCHVRTVFGTAQNPAYIREPLLLFSREKLGIQMFKISGGAVSVRLNGGGVQYNPTIIKQQKFVDDRIRKWQNRRQSIFPYWLTPLNPVVMGASGTTIIDVKIGQTIQFFTMANVSTGDYALSITEVRSGQTLCNGQWSSTNGIGDAAFPWIFDRPYLVKEGGRLRFTFTDLSGAPNNAFLTIAGRKIMVPVVDDGDYNSDIAPIADVYDGFTDETTGSVDSGGKDALGALRLRGRRQHQRMR